LWLKCVQSSESHAVFPQLQDHSLVESPWIRNFGCKFSKLRWLCWYPSFSNAVTVLWIVQLDLSSVTFTRQWWLAIRQTVQFIRFDCFLGRETCSLFGSTYVITSRHMPIKYSIWASLNILLRWKVVLVIKWTFKHSLTLKNQNFRKLKKVQC